MKYKIISTEEYNRLKILAAINERSKSQTQADGKDKTPKNKKKKSPQEPIIHL